MDFSIFTFSRNQRKIGALRNMAQIRLRMGHFTKSRRKKGNHEMMQIYWGPASLDFFVFTHSTQAYYLVRIMKFNVIIETPLHYHDK